MVRKTKMFTPERVSLLFLAIALVALAIYYALYEYGDSGNDVSTVVTATLADTLDDSGSAKSVPADWTYRVDAADSTVRGTKHSNNTKKKAEKKEKSDKKTKKANRNKKKETPNAHRDHLNEPVPDI